MVETEDFTIASLDLCDFDHESGRGRLVSYLLRDDLGGADLALRVAVVEARDHVWVMTASGPGSTGDDMEQTLSPIVAGFRSPP